MAVVSSLPLERLARIEAALQLILKLLEAQSPRRPVEIDGAEFAREVLARVSRRLNAKA